MSDHSWLMYPSVILHTNYAEFEETRTYGIIVGILESNTRSQNHVGVLSLVKPNMRDEEDTATEVGRFVWFWPVWKRY